MKQQVIDFITSLGAKASYSGKDKTMYITSSIKKGRKKAADDIKTVEEQVIEKFGFGLPFSLKTNK